MVDELLQGSTKQPVLSYSRIQANANYG